MEFKEAYETLESKFTSGDDIPVERATIKREEWEAIKNEINILESLEEKYDEMKYDIKNILENK